MTTATPGQLLDALVNELAAAICAVGGAPVPVTAGSGVNGAGMNVSLTVTSGIRGTIRLTLDSDGVAALLHTVLGPDAETSDAAAADLLKEMFGQAISSLRVQEPFSKISIAVGSVEPGTTGVDQLTHFALGLGDRSLQLAVAATLDAMPLQTDTVAPAPKPQAPARPAPPAAAVPAGNLDVVMDIDLPLSIRFGSTAMSIRALSALGPGSIVDMGRSPDDPVEVLVCGRVIARAEVVIVGGNYGIRITDLVSAADRVRAMEGQW